MITAYECRKPCLRGIKLCCISCKSRYACLPDRSIPKHSFTCDRHTNHNCSDRREIYISEVYLDELCKDVMQLNATDYRFTD